MDVDSETSETVTQQLQVQNRCASLLDFARGREDEPDGSLFVRDNHIKFCRRGLRIMPEGFKRLDCQRPWILFWCVHSLDLLGHDVPSEQKSNVAKFLARCQSADGGFGGGPQQISHLAPTYAAVSCLVTLGTREALDVIDRPALAGFLKRMKNADGSFRMHDGGESDMRAVYCALAVSAMTGLLSAELTQNTVDFISKCQTYEGGFGGQIDNEAHGGYSYCALAALVICGGGADKVDAHRALLWVSRRQMTVEGGFQGRTNKLVDGCYSFWQGATSAIATHLCKRRDGALEARSVDFLFHKKALEEYVLFCCQDPDGGLCDKPGKQRDFYHSNYCLSGLAIAQWPCSGLGLLGSVNGEGGSEVLMNSCVEPNDLVFNVSNERRAKAVAYFYESE